MITFLDIETIANEKRVVFFFFFFLKKKEQFYLKQEKIFVTKK